MTNSVPSTPARPPLAALVTPARVYALTRVGLGAWIALAPMQFGGKWFTAPQNPLLTGSLVRGSGARDVAMGLALLFTDRPRVLLYLGAAIDVFDAGLVVLARGRFSGQEVTPGVVGALSYAAVAVAVALFGTRSRVQARTA